jgi:hypothetical protein
VAGALEIGQRFALADAAAAHIATEQHARIGKTNLTPQQSLD